MYIYAVEKALGYKDITVCILIMKLGIKNDNS